MSVAGGSFSAGRVFRGGATSAVPSSYYMGFWPCQQADGDADDEQVTDRSGNGAHATLGSLTSVEAWNTAGYLESLASAGHSAQIPLASWTHRFSSGSLIIAAWAQLVKGGAAVRIFGNGITTALGSGFNVLVSTAGALQFNVAYGTSSSVSSGSTSPSLPYAADELHSWLLAYDWLDKSITVYVDGAIALNRNTTITPADFVGADVAVLNGPAIGGRPAASGTGLVATKFKMVHALDLAGKALPSNLAAIAQRLHAHPRLMLRDSDFVFA